MYLEARDKPSVNVPTISNAKGMLATKVFTRLPLWTHAKPELAAKMQDTPLSPSALINPDFYPKNQYKYLATLLHGLDTEKNHVINLNSNVCWG